MVRSVNMRVTNNYVKMDFGVTYTVIIILVTEYVLNNEIRKSSCYYNNSWIRQITFLKAGSSISVFLFKDSTLQYEWSTWTCGGSVFYGEVSNPLFSRSLKCCYNALVCCPTWKPVSISYNRSHIRPTGLVQVSVYFSYHCRPVNAVLYYQHESTTITLSQIQLHHLPDPNNSWCRCVEILSIILTQWQTSGNFQTLHCSS